MSFSMSLLISSMLRNWSPVSSYGKLSSNSLCHMVSSEKECPFSSFLAADNSKSSFAIFAMAAFAFAFVTFQSPPESLYFMWYSVCSHVLLYQIHFCIFGDSIPSLQQQLKIIMNFLGSVFYRFIYSVWIINKENSIFIHIIPQVFQFIIKIMEIILKQL